MVVADTTIDLALSALFGLCVPAVSGGMLEQTFPAELVVDLSRRERDEYSVGKDEEAWKIVAEEGFILCSIRNGWFSVVTGDGDPNIARQGFERRLKDAGGSVERAEQPGDGWVRISGQIPLKDGNSIVVLFTGEMTNRNAGFYGSAVLTRKNN